ncbi:uncharacterized protein LOC143927196 [Lithobates pipiens]
MKTSRAHAGMWWLLLLLLTSPGVDATKDSIEVPQNFQNLEHVRSVVSSHESRPEDLRSRGENLQRWSEAINDGDRNAIQQVASSSTSRNHGIDFEEIPQLDAYDHQIIIQLDSDGTVQTAADSLYNKEMAGGRSKSLLELDEQSGQLRALKSKGTNTIEITENTKLTVVGHGGQRGGEVSVGGKTAYQLAEVIAKLKEHSSPLHWSSNQGSVKEISLVSCNVGAGEKGEGFVRKFLIELKNRQIAVDSVSVRTVDVIVGEDGRKVTIDSDNPEWESRHNPAHKRKFYLDNNNKLVEVSDTTGRSPEWQKVQDLAVEYDPLARDNIQIFDLYYRDQNNVYYRFTDDDLAQFIKDSIRQRFGSEVDRTRLKTETLTVYTESGSETLEISHVEGLDGLLNNIKEIIQTANSKRMDLLKEYKEQLLEYGIQVDDNINIKDTWRQIQEQVPTEWNKLKEMETRYIYEEHARILMPQKNKFRNIRTCRETIEGKMEKLVKYFRFKHYIYSINMNDFYVNLYGTTDQNHISEVSEHIGEIRNRAENQGHVAYGEIKKMINGKDFVHMAKLWVSGQQDKIGKINPYDGMAVLATHVSEAVRNPDMFITNRQLWDLHSTWSQFSYHNPMTRGLTWSGNHAAIGLDYETSDQNIKEQIREETLSVIKRWTIFKNGEHYIERNLAQGHSEAKDMTLDVVKANMENVIKPLETIHFKRPQQRALSEDIRNDLLAIEEQGRKDSLETEFHLKMMEDGKQLVEKITEKIKEQSPEDLSKYQKTKLVERYGEGVKIVLQNKQNPSETKEILMPDMKDTLNSEGVLDSYFGESHSVSGKINHALGIYGTLVGFQAANQMFAEGRKWEGGVMLAQGVHGVSELTGINAAVNDFVGNSAQKSIARISTHLEETAAEEFTSVMSKAGSIAREVPVLSAAFTAFNIYEDLKQDSPIGIADAVLDGTIFITALAGPEMLPVTVALTIIRLGIDPLFHEIRHELDALPPDAGPLDKFVAVIKGVGLAIRDVANSFLDVLKQINIFGIIYNVYSLEEEHRKSMDTLHELQTAENYFKVLDEKDGGACHKKIDFTQGEKSAYGGNLRVELTDHRSMIVTLTDPVTSQKNAKEIWFEKDCETEDFVLGIGEAVNIKMQQKTATALWFIPIKTEEVISSMTPDDRSLYGTYIGNAKANRFFAVQQNIIKGLSYTLDKYHYELYGRDGNDIFFLGPQMSFVHGGNGQDMYYIPLDGGKTEICNQATDKLMDLLVFNVTFPQINARKIGNDLKLFYNNLHEIQIKKWFLGEEYQHMSFKSSDGILFNAGKVQLSGNVDLLPVTLDFSNQDSARNIDLQNSPWETVVSVIGTDYDDIINGNQLNNVILGRGGANTISGHEGKDMYIIQEKGSCDIIDNFANDDQMDIVELPVIFQSLKVAIKFPYSLKIWDSNLKICVIIKDWKRGWQWQHIIFKTKDLIVFQVSNTTAEPEISPLILDYSDSKEGVNINLNSIPGNEHIMTVIGSSHFDTIHGNSRANFIKKGRGGGNLLGGDGSDTYIIECGSNTIHINNYAEDGAMDILYVKEKYSKLRFQKPIHILQMHRFRIVSSSLDISSENCKIVLENWFKSEQNRHLQIQTEDGVIFSIPNGTEPVIYSIDNSRDTLPMDVFDTIFGIYEGATKIFGPPRYIKIIGNEKDNYIDPGTNGALLFGGDGRDTYLLRKNYEGNYDIDNYATDYKVDYLVLDISFRDIRYTMETTASSIKQIVLTAPSVAKWRCRLLLFGEHEIYRHLIVQTNDVWFTFSKDTLEIQPLFSDYRLLNKELHLNLSEGIFHSLTTVYGSLQEGNFIDGNALNNTIIGGKNTDVLYGEDGNDVLQGSSGKDYLSGGPGDDQIHGGEGDDLILGEAGNDLIYPGPGADTVYGGTGSDTLLFLGDINSKSGVFVNLHLRFGSGADAEGDLYFGMENILGTSYADILIGNDGDNYLNGAGGSDLIQPMGGYDVLHGGEGKDVYNLIDATGTKMINNFAMDGKEDLVYIDNSDTLEIKQLRSNDDHEMSFYYSTEPDARLRVVIKNWYISEKHRHLRLFRNGGGEVMLSGFFERES